MIINLNKVIVISKKSKKEGKTVGLITGCFDILHIGHLEFLREAKKISDVVIVGIDNDESIRMSKGNDKPVNSLIYRLEQLSELKSVDYVFPINDIYNFGSEEANSIHENLLMKIKPNFLLTVLHKDKYAKIKKERVSKLNIGFIEIKSINNTSSSEIMRKLIDTD